MTVLAPTSRPAAVVLDLDASPERIRARLASARRQRMPVVLIARPTSSFNLALDGIREGVVVGLVSEPYERGAIDRILQRGADPHAAYADVFRLATQGREAARRPPS